MNYKFITKSVYGLYLDICSGFGKLTAQILHLSIYKLEIIRLVYMIAPYSLSQHSLIYRMTWAHKEIFQYIEFLLEQRDFLTIHGKTLRDILQNDISCLI